MRKRGGGDVRGEKKDASEHVPILDEPQKSPIFAQKSPIFAKESCRIAKEAYMSTGFGERGQWG